MAITTKVIEQSRVSPPLGSVPTTSIPLTIFDVAMCISNHIQWLSFYEFSHSTQEFIETIVPSLKKSLSLALKLFFPFAGNFMCHPPPTLPYILYTDGDSVPFTVAESTANLDHLIMVNNYPRPVEDVHPLVPKLAPTRLEGSTRVFPLMALQVTIFPKLGFCVGVTLNHVAADGMTFSQFMKAWASICKNGEDYIMCPPLYDRSFVSSIPSIKGMESLFLKAFWDWTLTQNKEYEEYPSHENQVQNKYRFTFVLDGTQIERLKRWVKNQFHHDDSDQSLNLSTYVVTCALTWVCFLKCFPGDEDQQYNFSVLADIRNLLENPIPNTYFGNLLTIRVASIKRDVLGTNGIAHAAKAIGKEVWKVKTCKDLEPPQGQDIVELVAGLSMGVAGSPKFGLYEIDFGCGKPKMINFVQTKYASTGPNIISLCDMRDDKYGIQVSLVESRTKLEHFKALLEESLRMC